MARSRLLPVTFLYGALALAVLFVASPSVAADVEKQLLGVWTVESFYSEFKTTGEKKLTFGEKPKGYIAFTPEKRFIGILTAENRKKPETDEDRIAAFRSMFAYAGIYRVEGDRWITTVEVSWNEAWTGTEQMRFFAVEGDKLTINTPWLQDPNTPGNPEIRGVLIWRRVKRP
jgi:Lipocalin-like domain